MIEQRPAIGRGRRFLLWLLLLMGLALTILACSIVSVAPRRAIPPPVTHLLASQLRLLIQFTGQYGNTPNVQVWARFFEANSSQEFSLADKARLTCNGNDVKPSYPNNVIRTCPRQSPGGAYRFTYTDELGAAATVVVPVPAGSFAVLSPRNGSAVHIPTDGALGVQFSLPVPPPPHSSITQFYVMASCQPTPSVTCYSVENSYLVGATPTPLLGVPTPTAFPISIPPTPTPSSSKPTATVYENRGPPTPTPPPDATPTAPAFDGTVTQTGGPGTVALVGDYTQFKPGSGRIELSIEEQIAPDPGAFASAIATMGGDTTANITWVR